MKCSVTVTSLATGDIARLEENYGAVTRQGSKEALRAPLCNLAGRRILRRSLDPIVDRPEEKREEA